MVETGRNSPQASDRTTRRRQALYDLIMPLYLLSGLALVPMMVGETLVGAGVVGSIHESGLPDWLVRFVSGYEILVLFTVGAGLLVGWIPALVLCVLFHRNWRVLLPAVLIILTSGSLYLGGSGGEQALAVLGGLYATAASLLGLEWLIRRRLAGRR